MQSDRRSCMEDQKKSERSVVNVFEDCSDDEDISSEFITSFNITFIEIVSGYGPLRRSESCIFLYDSEMYVDRSDLRRFTKIQ